MKTLEQIIMGLSDEELRQAFDEIVNWRQTGVLQMDGIVRKVHADFVQGGKIIYPLHAIETPFLFEIGKRHYAEKNRTK